MKYQYIPCEMDCVESDPEEYIIPECLEACKILWNKNIFTIMCSNNEDNGNTWIAMHTLSAENQEILNTIKLENVVVDYCGATTLLIKKEGNEAKELLNKYAEMFVIQDIPYGYTSIDEILMDKFSLKKEIENPNYEYMVPKTWDDETSEYLAYQDYLDSNKSKKTIEIFDPTAMKKSKEEYIKELGLENLCDFVTNKVYNNEYYYNKHCKYKKYKKDKKIIDIKEKFPSFKNYSEQTLMYVANYLYGIEELKFLPESISINELIDKFGRLIDQIYFYDESDEIYDRLGSDVKGFSDHKKKILYVRKNLEEPLKEITIYHELHHIMQFNEDTEEYGINQVSNIGRLIMEAQTQFCSEEIYKLVNNITFSIKKIKSEDLRMLNGGTITSELHNYELFDNLLTQISFIIGEEKDFFVKINYLYNNEGMKILEEKYNKAKDKYELPITFDNLLYYLDYIYVVDYLSYINNSAKETLIKNQETQHEYEIHPNKGEKLSRKKQLSYIDKIERNIAVCLLESNETNDKIKLYADYVIVNEIKQILLDLISNNIEQELER